MINTHEMNSKSASHPRADLRKKPPETPSLGAGVGAGTRGAQWVEAVS